MSIERVYDAALELSGRLEEIGLPFCFISGAAIQRWGEPRITVDADATVLISWADDERLVDALLSHFAPRRPDARELALKAWVLLVLTGDAPLDIALGALPFEERSVERASL